MLWWIDISRIIRVLEPRVVPVEESLNTAKGQGKVVDNVAELWWKIEEWKGVANAPLLESSNDLTIPIEEVDSDGFGECGLFAVSRCQEAQNEKCIPLRLLSRICRLIPLSTLTIAILFYCR